jgi:hypothetical protein
LVFAALSPLVVAVFFEQGGYAVSRGLEVFQVAASGELVGRCSYSNDSAAISDLEDLRAAFPRQLRLTRCQAYDAAHPPDPVPSDDPSLFKEF